MICIAFHELSRLSCVMPFGFVYLQLWLKDRAAIQILVLKKCVCVCERLSNVALADYLGARSLTEEEHLYIRLCRLAKHFSTGEEIFTYW
jgi:hypothetical protein